MREEGIPSPPRPARFTFHAFCSRTQDFASTACQDVGKSVSFKDDEVWNAVPMSGLKEECSHES